jgi:hypothetical protein
MDAKKALSSVPCRNTKRSSIRSSNFLLLLPVLDNLF